MDERINNCTVRALVALAGAASVWVWAPPCLGQGVHPAPAGEEAGRLTLDAGLSLDPTWPQVGALPGGLTPAFGERSLSEGEWRFDLHGFLAVPLNAGINSRADPQPGQSSTVLHAPPVVPDDRETFSHTGVVPTTLAQLNFSMGNSIVSGNVSIVARQANASTSFIEPSSQLGITDAFLSVAPPLSDRLQVHGLLGAFTLRYGSTGEYDEGRYGTPLIARISGVGEQIALKTALGDFALVIEQGFHGQTNKAGVSVTPDVWNNFADPGAGSSFVGHLHLGLGYRNLVMLGGHFLRAFSQDDRAGTMAPDGRIDVLAGDVRLTMGRFGHLYLALVHTDALQARTVSRIISVLNTQGGPGLMDSYLGPLSNGTGKLLTVGGQYDLSIGRLVSYPVPFSGDGPDIFVSLHGMQTQVSSDDLTRDGVTKRKFGLEATYGLLSWLAASARYDRVDPDVADKRQSFSVLSPRIILHTDWQSTDQLVLQYSHWFNGSLTTVRVGDPPVEDVSVVPDGDMVSLSVRMWW